MIDNSVVIDIPKASSGIMMRISTLLTWTLFWFAMGAIGSTAFIYGAARHMQIEDSIQAERLMMKGTKP